MSQILASAQRRHEEMIQALEKLVMLESPSGEPQAVNRVADHMAEAFRQLGADVERLPQVGFGDHLRVGWGHGHEQVLLLGHMDTVWPLGETTRRPFRRDGDRATGPGVFDMKGGLVIGLTAVAALQELGLDPGCRLLFLLNSDEEVGSPSSRPWIETEARRSKAVLVLEPSRQNALVTWRKGVGRFQLEIQGKASHSGAAHERGVSAVQELAHQILRLEAMTDYGQGTTVNVGIVSGGSAVNVRPAKASASIDLRVTRADQAACIAQAILNLQPVNPQATVTVSGGMNRPPWEVEPQGEALFERAGAAGERLGLVLSPAGSGGGSDGNFTAALGVPTLDGLGVLGDDAHAMAEWVDLASLPVRAALLAELLLDLGS